MENPAFGSQGTPANSDLLFTVHYHEQQAEKKKIKESGVVCIIETYFECFKWSLNRGQKKKF